MEKKEAMLDHIKDLYIPKGMEAIYTTLCNYIWKHKLDSITEDLTNVSHVPLLIVNVAGKGKWAVFKGFDIVRADFNHVGKTYAEAYLRFDNESRNSPRRLFVKSSLIAVIKN